MRNLSSYICVAIIIVSLFGSVSFAGVISPGLESSLSAAAPNERIPVIITLSDQVDISAYKSQDPRQRRPALVTALRSLAALKLTALKTFLEDRLAMDLRELWLINGMAAKLPASAVQLLEFFPGIASVRLDEVIQPPEVLASGAGPVEWNIDAIGAPQLWDLGFRGQSIVVANMDSGVDVDHNDLSPRYRGGTNSWFDPYGQHASPYDSHAAGHGTGTMGIMVGGDATGTAIGVAPDAQWIAVKIFNDAGEAELSAIHQGFQWLLDPDGDPNTDDAPDVVNNSWGFRELVNICYLEFQQDIQILKTAGIAVVFSAGNEGLTGLGTSISPANNPESFAVGAVSSTLNIAGFSSRGPSACVLEDDFFPEVVAPGVSVKTADRTLGGVLPISSRYVSGTSFAAPHVSGAMALLLNAFPQVTVSDVEAALKDTAVDLGGVGPDNEYGFGMIDVMAAYRALVPCTDADVDGYYVETVCGTAPDCNDNDDTIYPGASEVKHDGIDQDCNEYDLTIEVPIVNYYPATDELEVTATSALNDTANLVLVGFGPMNWNPDSMQWEIFVPNALGDPGIVTVSGVEGSETSPTAQCVNTCPGDLDNDGVVNFTDLALMKANFFTDCSTLPPGEVCVGDIDNDGGVNFADLVLLKQDFFREDCWLCN